MEQTLLGLLSQAPIVAVFLYGFHVGRKISSDFRDHLDRRDAMFHDALKDVSAAIVVASDAHTARILEAVRTIQGAPPSP